MGASRGGLPRDKRSAHARRHEHQQRTAFQAASANVSWERHGAILTSNAVKVSPGESSSDAGVVERKKVPGHRELMFSPTRCEKLK
jgi:hypothetical protein